MTELATLQSELKKNNLPDNYYLIIMHSVIQIVIGLLAYSILMVLSSRELRMREQPKINDRKERYEARPTSIADHELFRISSEGNSKVLKSENMVQSSNVCKVYSQKKIEALKEVDFQVIERSIVAIVGPNGAGKSTL